MPRELRIGVEPNWLPEGLPHLPILFPFWGIPKIGAADARLKRFDLLRDTGREFLRLSPLSSSDVAVLPFDWQFALADSDVLKHAKAIAGEAQAAGRKILVFFFHDSEEKVPIENAIVFRTSLQRNERSNEFGQPAWIDDYFGIDLAETLRFRPKDEQPVVGFCGFAGYRLPPDARLVRQLRARIRSVYRGFPSPTVREQAIGALRKDPRVATRFTLRENFYAGVAGATPEARQVVRNEYLANLVESDYVLCARGGGNFSYRFFETLAAGRIPLFVDTNCSLPFDFDIGYRELIPVVDANRVSTIADVVCSFHDSLSRVEFLDLQRRCRSVWENYLSPVGFFRHLHLCLDRVQL